jgi:hypothetical protein
MNECNSEIHTEYYSENIKGRIPRRRPRHG